MEIMLKYRKSAIIVFAKAPVYGKVKTRLARSKGEGFALHFYMACLEHLFGHLKKLKSKIPVDVLLYLTPESDSIFFEKYPIIHNVVQQKGIDLGARMKNALQETLATYAKAVLIGSDIPGLDGQSLLHAMDALENADCVIGPAEDGGYYLIGFQCEKFHDCFDDIPWSTDKVFEQTLSKLKSVETAILRSLRDVDDIEDLQSLISGGHCPPWLKDFQKYKHETEDS